MRPEKVIKLWFDTRARTLLKGSGVSTWIHDPPQMNKHATSQPSPRVVRIPASSGIDNYWLDLFVYSVIDVGNRFDLAIRAIETEWGLRFLTFIQCDSTHNVLFGYLRFEEGPPGHIDDLAEILDSETPEIPDWLHNRIKESDNLVTRTKVFRESMLGLAGLKQAYEWIKMWYPGTTNPKPIHDAWATPKSVTSFIQSGYVWAPYIPVSIEPASFSYEPLYTGPKKETPFFSLYKALLPPDKKR